MRFVLFFILLFAAAGCLPGAPVKKPFPDFGALTLIRISYYLFTEPRRRQVRYWRKRRRP
jgi:hypothetical protein